MEDLYKVAGTIAGYIVDTMKSFGYDINAKGFSDDIDCMFVFNNGDIDSCKLFKVYIRVVEGSVELWFEEFSKRVNILDTELLFLFKNVTSLEDIKDKLTIKIMECVLLD